ncbi:histidine kinase [Cytophagaceae bacterium DM2B3-1]|uniref:Histidine kinase n=1 Tax=Xanthocytophaga flava TaxID=3048013 RepID=A0ABT7CQ35_9BACT|nr:histidine kinase [Xanthocytophaga flavus]MDJ1495856.1 histidine kinase [Xanthocytophaga flavus]
MKNSFRQFRFFLFQVIITLTMDMAFAALIYFLIKGFTTLWQEVPKAGQDQSYVWIILGNSLEALATVMVIRLFQHVDFQIRKQWLRYMVLGIVIFSITQLINSLVYHFETLQTEPFAGNSLRWLFGAGIVSSGLLTYTFVKYDEGRNQRITEQQLQLLRLEQLKTQAELDALQAKINPHFLYNALNSLITLIEHEPKKAIKMVILLSRFFRYSTTVPNTLFHTLSDEIELVRTYLEIEQVRFGNRLTYHIDIQTNFLLKQPIPRFLLQPLVENAVKHGVSKISNPGIILLKVKSENNQLILSVHDNGPLFSNNVGFGYGLQSIYDKLKLLYKEKTDLVITNDPDKHVAIHIDLGRINTQILSDSIDNKYSYDLQNHFGR